MRRGAIFMDRDGTISEEVGYVNHLSRWRLLPRSLEAIRLVNQAGLLAIVATNQSGVARGYFSQDLVEAVHGKLRNLAEESGARLDAIYYCPHHPSEGAAPWRSACDCRKPKPGMILRAAREHAIDLPASFVIGDSVVDIEASRECSSSLATAAAWWSTRRTASALPRCTRRRTCWRRCAGS